MTAPAAGDDAAFAALLAAIERRGLRVTSYKSPCLKRRLAVRMRARGVHTFAAYAAVLERDPGEFDRLLDALTINVTKFFRNPETYAVLRERVVPYLAGLNRGVNIWSAGCASGEEPYTLAILLREHGLGRVRVDATDLDPTALETLRRAEYPATAVEDVPPELLRRYFSAGPPYAVVPAVVRLVRQFRHDLTRDPAPAPPYDLITCRNVVIYFDRPTQEQLFLRFHDALMPGGFLLLGKVETLFGPARGKFEVADARERLFRKP
jgi:chemotaxis methyl-accepting protein methylase